MASRWFDSEESKKKKKKSRRKTHTGTHTHLVILCDTPGGKGKRGSRCGRPTLLEFNQRPDGCMETNEKRLGNDYRCRKGIDKRNKTKESDSAERVVAILQVYTNKVTRKKNVDVDKRATKTLTATNRPGLARAGWGRLFSCVGASAEQRSMSTPRQLTRSRHFYGPIHLPSSTNSFCCWNQSSAISAAEWQRCRKRQQNQNDYNDGRDLIVFQKLVSCWVGCPLDRNHPTRNKTNKSRRRRRRRRRWLLASDTKISLIFQA